VATKHRNSVLEFISQHDTKLAQRKLRAVTYQRGDVIGEIWQPLKDVVFPESALISLVVPLNTGDVVEAAIVGHRSLVGGGAAFGERAHIHTGICQLPGTATVMAAEDLRDIANHHPALRDCLFHHQQFLLGQAQQSAACNAKHHIPARLATWLLRARDALGKDYVDLTQEFVAEMLGVQRPSISIVASQLQENGLISYRRGHVKILDDKGLEEAACECYRTLQRLQHQLAQSCHAEHV